MTLCLIVKEKFAINIFSVGSPISTRSYLDYASFPFATSEKYIDLQEETKRQSLASPIQHQLNEIMGLSIIGENRLAVQPLVERPMKLVTQKQINKTI